MCLLNLQEPNRILCYVKWKFMKFVPTSRMEMEKVVPAVVTARIMKLVKEVTVSVAVVVCLVISLKCAKANVLMDIMDRIALTPVDIATTAIPVTK